MIVKSSNNFKYYDFPHSYENKLKVAIAIDDTQKIHAKK